MKKRIRIFLGGTGVFLFLVLAAFFATRQMIKGEDVPVPDVVGRDIVSALKLLNTLDLNLKIDRQEFSSEVPENNIISQRPGSEDSIKKGRDVWITLSRGSQKGWVPDLKNETLAGANAVLGGNGFLLGRVSEVSYPLPAGQVIVQAPRSGTSLARGKPVDLLISKGKLQKWYLMPDFVGRRIRPVLIDIKSRGFVLGKISYQEYEGLEKETIIDQIPKAGFRIRKGGGVDFVVCRKAEKTG